MPDGLPTIPIPPAELVIAPPIVPPSAELDDFKPNCPDCKYDLGASPDGRCPECGLRFTHPGLRRQWVARKQARRQNARQLGIAAAIGLLIVISGALLLGSMVGFVSVITCWSIAGGIWAWFNRDFLMARSYYFLAFLVPIVLVLPVVAATPFGLFASIALGLIACTVGWLALRWSPLISGILLLCFVIAPLLLLAGVLYAATAADIEAGRYWSSFDQPTPHGWAALPAPHSRKIALWITVIAAAIAIVVLAYLRRALVRLKHRSRAAAL